MALRILAIMTVLALVSTCWVGTAEAVSGSLIARKARQYVGWYLFTYDSALFTGKNTNKCNIFVANVLEEAKATVPHRRWGLVGPIGAGEWGDRNSSYLTSDPCWHNTGSPEIGDVIGDGRHVGIVTGRRETTSALTNKPVTSNDWGFRPYGGIGSRSSVIYWRYIC